MQNEKNKGRGEEEAAHGQLPFPLQAIRVHPYFGTLARGPVRGFM